MSYGAMISAVGRRDFTAATAYALHVKKSVLVQYYGEQSEDDFNFARLPGVGAKTWGKWKRGELSQQQIAAYESRATGNEAPF